MKSSAVFTTIWCLIGSALTLGQTQTREQLPREVTVTAIPGVVAAGVKWQLAWQGSAGKALVALQTAGLPASDPAYQRSVTFLLSSQ